MSDNLKGYSIAKIDEGITYIQESFLKPLLDTGEEVYRTYDNANLFLQSDTITPSLLAQRNKLDGLKEELNTIFKHAKGQFEESEEIIQKENTSIDDSIVE